MIEKTMETLMTRNDLSRLWIMLILLLAAVCSYAQQVTVKGRVTDQNHDPLTGVTVLEQGTNNGVVTDIEGNFKINVKQKATLSLSYIGFIPKQVVATGKEFLNIMMEEDNGLLNEVVVVGYGLQKKATLSGSVTSVSGEKLLKTPVTNVSQSLAGRMPGVVAISNGAEPGYDGATIRIRGVNTFGDASPLIVVDGVPGRSLERIDPSTIESMSVMKDASAAIYGAQAANGVIVITTKRGKEGKPKVGFTYNYGLTQPTTLPEMCNAYEYATLMNEIDTYAGNTPRYTDEDFKLYQDGSDPWGHPNTDWFDELIKTWSTQTYTNATIEGGTSNVGYFVSASAKTQDAFYENSGTKYKQFDLKSNLDIKVNDYIKFTVNLTGRLEDRKFPTRSAENIFRMLMRSKPNSPAYWPTGEAGPDIEFGDNPVVICTNQTGYQKDKNYVVNGDFGVDIKIPYIKGLTFKGTASLDKSFRYYKTWETPWYLYSWDGTSYNDDGTPTLVEGKKGFTDARLTEKMVQSHNILLSGILNYNTTIKNDHAINLLAGVERITGANNYFSAYRRYYISTAIDELFAGGEDELTNDGSSSKEARLNYFGRMNYSYKSKYLAEFVWRYQASYIFEHNNRFGFFPGVSLGYAISEENFWKPLKPIIHFAKIRASWGQTGNDLIDPYQYMASYTFNSLTYLTGEGSTKNKALAENVAPNNNVTWETATQKNIGLDLQFLKGDLAFTIDYFRNDRKDILCTRNASVPNSSGLSLPDENIGKVRNQGVDFSIDYHKRLGDWTIGAGLNGVYAKNKIIFWDEAEGTLDYQRSTGRPIGANLYYQAIGIYQTQEEIDATPHWAGAQPGDIIFKDVNEDGVIDGNDRVRNDKTSVPTFTGGMNIDVAWRNFDLTMLFQGAFGGVFEESSESGDFANFLKSFYDNRWTVDNPSTTYPRTYNRSNEYWVSQANTWWLHKSDYVRLKTIELGYTLPNTWLAKTGIEKLRLYVSGFNLFTIAPDMKNYDPENTSGRGYNYPLNRVLNFGVNLSF